MLLYLYYAINDDDTFVLERIDRRLFSQINFYFPWITLDSEKNIQDPITNTDYDYHSEEISDIINENIVNYGTTEVDGEL